jgi:hypothetical protein
MYSTSWLADCVRANNARQPRQSVCNEASRYLGRSCGTPSPLLAHSGDHIQAKHAGCDPGVPHLACSFDRDAVSFRIRLVGRRNKPSHHTQVVQVVAITTSDGSHHPKAGSDVLPIRLVLIRKPTVGRRSNLRTLGFQGSAQPQGLVSGRLDLRLSAQLRIIEPVAVQDMLGRDSSDFVNVESDKLRDQGRFGRQGVGELECCQNAIGACAMLAIPGACQRFRLQNLSSLWSKRRNCNRCSMSGNRQVERVLRRPRRRRELFEEYAPRIREFLTAEQQIEFDRLVAQTRPRFEKRFR